MYLETPGKIFVKNDSADNRMFRDIPKTLFFDPALESNAMYRDWRNFLTRGEIKEYCQHGLLACDFEFKHVYAAQEDYLWRNITWKYEPPDEAQWQCPLACWLTPFACRSMRKISDEKKQRKAQQRAPAAPKEFSIVDTMSETAATASSAVDTASDTASMTTEGTADVVFDAVKDDPENVWAGMDVDDPPEVQIAKQRSLLEQYRPPSKRQNVSKFQGPSTSTSPSSSSGLNRGPTRWHSKPTPSSRDWRVKPTPTSREPKVVAPPLRPLPEHDEWGAPAKGREPSCTPPEYERKSPKPLEEHWGKKRQLPVPPISSNSVSEIIANTVHTVGSGDDTLIKEEDNVSIPVPHFSLNTPLSRYPGWFV